MKLNQLFSPLYLLTRISSVPKEKKKFQVFWVSDKCYVQSQDGYYSVYTSRKNVYRHEMVTENRDYFCISHETITKWKT